MIVNDYKKLLIESNNTSFPLYKEKFLKKNYPHIYEDILLYTTHLDLQFKERIWIYLNRVNLKPCCLTCGRSVNFQNINLGYFTYCSSKCSHNNITVKNKTKETNIAKYGFANPMQNSDVKERTENTMLDRYGVKSPMQSKIIRDKIFDEYGVDHPSKSKEVLDKWKATLLKNHGTENPMQSVSVRESIKDKYGVDHAMKSEETKDRISKTFDDIYGGHPMRNKEVYLKFQNTSIENWGTKHPMLNNIVANSSQNSKNTNWLPRVTEEFGYLNIINADIITKEFEIKCDICDSTYKIGNTNLRNRISHKTILCTNCNPISHNSSGMEMDLYNFIVSNIDCNIITNTKSIIKPYELDIYIPFLNLAFEFNGIYWHSEVYKDKNYHLDKTLLCKENDIQLIHIWEDDWRDKQDIVKSMILNKLGKSNKIYARKCLIKEVRDNKVVKDFLNNNHMQGFVGSKIKIGLYYNDELVSLMTLGSLRISLGQKSDANSYELLRFCNKLNTSVIGGASKLFKYFCLERLSRTDFQ